MKLERRRAYNPKNVWKKQEEKLLLNEIKKNGFNADKLTKLFPDRMLPSIRSKVRKLRIKHDFFGKSYRDKKGEFTSKVALITKPKVIFEAYAGAGHQTFKWLQKSNTVFAADSMKAKLKQFKSEAIKEGFNLKGQSGKWYLFERDEKKVFYFTGDAIQAAADLNSNDIKVDLIDLDTCGSTMPTLPYFLLMLKPKHLVITHGEFHSMRFNREDVLRRIFVHKDITVSPLPLSVEDMSKELDKSVKTAALRAHNETSKSFWLVLKKETWLGEKFHGMLRRYYKVCKPTATADCLNYLSK